MNENTNEQRPLHDTDPEVIVVGGGASGLAAAALMARRGLSVNLLEANAKPGGLARTECRDGFYFNRGAHALYRRGAAAAVLDELEINRLGRRATGSGGVVLDDGRLDTAPAGLVSLLTTGLLSLRGKLLLARTLSTLTRGLDRGGVSLADWLDAQVPDPKVRDVICMLVRLTTYAHAPDRLDVCDAAHQLAGGLMDGVDYLDGGWQQLVDGLVRRTQRAGVQITTGTRAKRLRIGGGRVVGVETSTGLFRSRGVVVAGGGNIARRLLPRAGAPESARAVGSFLERAQPARVACLDIGLHRVPRPKHTLLLGTDRPVYVSVHSATAALAPPGGGLIHAMRYLAPDESPPADALRVELEDAVHRLQPGFAELVAHAMFRPNMTVATDIPAADDGGIGGRPGVRVMPGLYVAGDWVGAEGMLADAASASAREAAAAVMADLNSEADRAA